MDNTVTYSISHLFGEVGVFEVLSPRHRNGLILPSCNNLLIIGLDPPVGFISDVLNKFEHTPLAQEECGSGPVTTLITDEDRKGILGPVVRWQSITREKNGAASWIERFSGHDRWLCGFVLFFCVEHLQGSQCGYKRRLISSRRLANLYMNIGYLAYEEDSAGAGRSPESSLLGITKQTVR